MKNSLRERSAKRIAVISLLIGEPPWRKYLYPDFLAYRNVPRETGWNEISVGPSRNLDSTLVLQISSNLKDQWRMFRHNAPYTRYCPTWLLKIFARYLTDACRIYSVRGWINCTKSMRYTLKLRIEIKCRRSIEITKYWVLRKYDFFWEQFNIEKMELNNRLLYRGREVQ